MQKINSKVETVPLEEKDRVKLIELADDILDEQGEFGPLQLSIDENGQL